MLILIYGTYIHLFEIPMLVFLLLGLFHDFFNHNLPLRIRYTKYNALFFLSMLLFTTSIFTSMIFAYDPYLVIKDGVKWIEIDIIIIGLFFYLKSFNRFKVFYWILFLSCFLFIVEIIIQYLFGSFEFKSYRIFPGYEAAFALALLLPFLKRKFNWIMILAFLCIVSAFFSLSRGAWLASLIIIVNSIKLFDKSTKIIVLSVIIALLLISFNLEPLKSYIFIKLSAALSVEDASNIERISLMKLAWSAFLSSPILGIGALNLFDFMIQHGFQGISIGPLEVTSVHNTFLQIAAEEGLFGLVTFILMIISSWAILLHVPIYHKKHIQFYWGLKNFFIVMIVNFFLGYIASQFRFFIALLFGLIISTLGHYQYEEKSLTKKV